MEKIIIIGGPTATGKTDLSVDLAGLINAEIINADALQVYRYLNIGTAKPTKEQLKGIRCHLIDVVNPDEEFDVFTFVNSAQKLIREIINQGKKVIISGGTGFYLRALVWGLAEDLPSPDYNLRNQLKEMEKENGDGFLYNELKNIDPEAALKLHQRDIFRIIRAIEVYKSTGMQISSIQNNHSFKQQNYDYLWFSLYIERSELRDRIKRRVYSMFEHGFVDEVKKIIDMGYAPELKPMRSLGYKHICRYLKGEILLENAVESTITDTNRYSKRQKTWIKGEKAEIEWINPLVEYERENFFQLANQFLLR